MERIRLSPEDYSEPEMRRLTDSLYKSGIRIFVFSFHSPSIQPGGTPYVQNQADLDNFKRKAEAGADSAITQYFFNPDAYFRFLDDCQRMAVDIPVIPGIMPITNYKQLARFSDSCGAEIPRWIRKRLEAYGEDLESIRQFGLDVVTHLCEQLLDGGSPGLHFYSMNRSEPVKTIWTTLGLTD